MKLANKLFKSLPSISIERHGGAFLWEKDYDYLKFFEDGSVRIVVSAGTSDQISKWIDTTKNGCDGKFNLDGQKLKFEVKQFNGLILSYEGIIVNEKTIVLQATNSEGCEFNYLFEDTGL